uniref:indole-3-pyruvate monooxygenase n=1 Tax=Aegilops tauschii subsp. strangulata TaxID=200361 RepID=A0A453MLL9_AEGTS
MEEVVVLIVGAGPAGLATAACVSQFSIPYVIVERENCSASLWRNRTYDRLKLHLAREFCELPHMPYPADTPTYIPKNTFIKYVDDYIECFAIHPRYLTVVESSTYDFNGKYWSIMAHDMAKCKIVNYRAKFLVVASGENSVENIPVIPGLENFPGVAIHSSCYKSGIDYSGRNVLVIGSGNSGMEIAYDLASHGANTSIIIRSPVCILYVTLTANLFYRSYFILHIVKDGDPFVTADSCNDKGINPTRDDTSPLSSSKDDRWSPFDDGKCRIRGPLQAWHHKTRKGSICAEVGNWSIRSD